MMPPDSLKLRVLEAARQRPAPRRGDRLAVTIALAALAVAGMSAVLEWVPGVLGEVGGAAHAAGRPAGTGAWIVGGTFALAVAATRLALPARRSMLAPARGVLLAVAIAVPLLVGGWLVLWHGAYADPFTRTGWRCFTLTTLTAPWPFAVLAYVGRRAEARYPRTTGAALGAAAGAWAAAMVELWCPLATESHVLVGHVLPLAALGLAGAALGARVLGRAAPSGR